MLIFLLSLNIIFTILTVSIDAQCFQLEVSNAAFNPQIDGTYYLSSYILCNNAYVWQQNYNEYQPTYFIYFVAPYWIIGVTACDLTVGNQKAYSTSEDYYYPYQMTGWLENVPTNGSFVRTGLTVSCANGLTPGAIAGIVIGSVFGAILLVMIISMLCVKIGHKKHERDVRRTACNVQNDPQVYDNAIEINTIRVQAPPPPPYSPFKVQSTAIATYPTEQPPAYVQ